MKFSKYVFFIILISFFSCTKNKPPIGKYIGNFNGSYVLGDSIVKMNREEYLFIINSYKESIIMSSSPNTSYGGEFTLTKGNNKSIKGIIDIKHIAGGGPGYVFNPISIEGNWEKKGGIYYIKGEFTYIYEYIPIEPPAQTYTVKGEYIIQSLSLE